MPIYSWKCEQCGESIELLRSISESDEGPGPEDEQITGPCKGQEGGAHSWKRTIGAASIVRGANWGAKGSW